MLPIIFIFFMYFAPLCMGNDNNSFDPNAIKKNVSQEIQIIYDGKIRSKIFLSKKILEKNKLKFKIGIVVPPVIHTTMSTVTQEIFYDIYEGFFPKLYENVKKLIKTTFCDQKFIILAQQNKKNIYNEKFCLDVASRELKKDLTDWMYLVSSHIE